MAQFDIDEDLQADLADLIGYLLEEKADNGATPIPEDAQGCWELYRKLVIERQPARPSQDYLDDEGATLGDIIGDLDILNMRKSDPDIEVGDGGISIWQGNPVRLRVDCITHVVTTSVYGSFDASVDSVENDITVLAGTSTRADQKYAIDHFGDPTEQGEPMMTFGGNLRCAYIAHVPVPDGGDLDKLRATYDTAFETVRLHDCLKFAVPLLGLEERGYDKTQVAQVAADAAREFLEKRQARLSHVIFIAADDAEEAAFKQALGL